MTIEKLPSGRYRVKQMKGGKMYTTLFEYKPSKREAEEAIRNLITLDIQKPNKDLTFKEAAQKYIDMKDNILSPNTIREYSLTCNRLSDWFISMRIDDIDQIAINKQINELSATRSPKTVRNYHGFISTILGTFRPDMKIYTTLPQKRKYEAYIPTDEDVKNILHELQGTEYYIPVVLACYGMRRGEILALQPEDVDSDGTIHINKALAIDSDRKKVVKSTKTTDSQREIIVPKEIADMIHNQGYIYKFKPGGIREKLVAVQDKLGIPNFTLHKLRHYFASKMLTITDPKTVQSLGGWKTDSVMKNVYAHSMKEEQEKAKRLAVEKFQKSIL